MNGQAESVSPSSPRVLLTGRPGSGKTTVVRRTVERIGPDRCAGFYTEEVRDGGRRIGFDVVTLAGQRVPLARAGAPGPRVSRYGVDVEAFEGTAVAALEAALDAPDTLLVIDELGKMEFYSERFLTLLERAFAAARAQPILGTAMSGSHPLLDELREREDVRWIRVTPENRDALPARLSELYSRIR